MIFDNSPFNLWLCGLLSGIGLCLLLITSCTNIHYICLDTNTSSYRATHITQELCHKSNGRWVEEGSCEELDYILRYMNEYDEETQRFLLKQNANKIEKCFKNVQQIGGETFNYSKYLR